MFVRIDAVRRPLSPPYEGPFKVLEKKEKTFIIDKSGKNYTVSVDRLKPALTSELPCPRPVPRPATVDAADVPAGAAATVTPVPDNQLDPVSWPLPTRYGRRPRPVDRLRL